MVHNPRINKRISCNGLQTWDQPTAEAAMAKQETETCAMTLPKIEYEVGP